MTTGELIACCTLGFGLLANAWRGGGVSAALSEAVKTLTGKCEDLEEKIERVDKVPELERRIGALESLVNAQSDTIHKSIRPAVVRNEEHIKALDARVNSVKGMAAVRAPYRSKPRIDDDE